MVKQQKHKEAWCPICKRMTMFIEHADVPNKWVCTAYECFQYTTSKLKEPPKVEKQDWYGLAGITPA
jgi:hypothetical protein